MTRAGGAATVGAALCLAAGGFGATPLYVPGLAALVMCAVAAGWVLLAARGARVVRRIDRQSLVEGGSLPVRVGVTRSRLPPPGASLRAWEGGPLLALPRERGAAPPGIATLSGLRRGRHRFGPASLEIADPFGLCRRTVHSADDEVLVLPRIEPVELTELDGVRGRWHGAGGVTPASGATDVDSLQPHRPGAPASRIHWPTVARTGMLIERRLVADGDQLPLVVVDTRAPASAQALDQAVRAAASLCVHLARRGGCSLLFPGDRQPTPVDQELGGFAEARVRLALLGPESGVSPLTPASSVLWVSAAVAPAGLPPTVGYLVSPHPQPGRPSRFAVAGCRGYELAASRSWSVAV